jgi:multidrug resistance efflux pump
MAGLRLTPRRGRIPRLTLAKTTLSLAGVVLAVATTLALATLWLLLTEPVTVADAVARGDVSPLMSALAGVLANAVRGLLDYL